VPWRQSPLLYDEVRAACGKATLVIAFFDQSLRH
jgi:hypothetical protein